MTERLYYHDSYLLEFDAKVLKINKAEDGFAVILDRSAFYPTSGGQFFDTGTIGGCRVINVTADNDTVIHHFANKPDFLAGDAVTGKIDYIRRRDNMQKHTGQHILSRAFIEAVGASTISAHLGEEDSTVDLDATELSSDQIIKSENLANDIIFQNRPVTTKFVSPDEIDKYPLRKKPPEGKDTYRLIIIDDFDWSACGGTHCSTTGSVGLIKITSQEKIRGRVRLHFLTGFLALDDYRWRHNQIEEISNLFSRHARESLEGVKGLLDENRKLKYEYLSLRRRMRPAIISEMIEFAKDFGNVKVIARDMGDEDISEVKEIGLELVKTNRAVFIASISDKLLIAASGDSGLAAGKLMKRAAEKFGGRGGGSDQIAQGGGFSPDKLKVLIEDPTIILE